jgi:NitT/TauT family transport system substrate-binding protein
MTFRSRRIIAAGAAMLVMGALGTACTSSSANSSGARGLTNVTIAQATASLLFAPIYVAQDHGLFRKNGLNVKVVIAGGASTALDAVVSNSAQFAACGLSDVLLLASKGKFVQAFASLVTANPDDIVVTKQFAASKKLTTASPLADKVRALSGATIGVVEAGTVPQQIVQWLLPQYGVSASAVKYVALHDPATALAAMQHNRVDGIAFPPPGPQSAISAGVAEMWIDSSNGEIKPGFWSGMVASSAYLRANKKTAVALARSLEEAEQYIGSDPTAAAKLIQKDFTGQSSAAYEAGWEAQEPVIAKTVAVNEGQFKSVISFLKGAGTTVPSDVTFSKVMTNAVAASVTGGRS